MKVVCGKELNREEIALIKSISLECGILFDTARLLYCRKIDTVQKAKEFLNPGKHGFYAPMLFSQMKSVVSRIDYARQNGETVLICGDYDADGVCATTILYNCLKEFGVNALYTIPEREDGYGIDLEKIEEICSDNVVDLVITVDCGISEREKIEELMEVGIDVIVTDHHEPPEALPNCLIINPKVKDCGYPFDGLCGAGVAYKLGYALIGERADKYLDFVALATVADSMDLVGENRSLVFEGLKLFNSPKLRSAFKYLLGDSANKQITSQTLAYNFAPRVNAGGRMGDAYSSLMLFLLENEREVFDLAVKLNSYNLSRQVRCDEIYKKSKEIIKENALYKNSVIVVANEEWNTGFVGIVAAKLVEDYNKPVIVFAGHDGFLKGSARSVPELNIYNAINECKDYLIGFGGHSQAAGVSLEIENFQAFYDKLCVEVDKTGYVAKAEKEIYVEWETEGFSLRFAREICKLEPFGTGNRKPLFATTARKIISEPIKKGSPHYTFNVNGLDVLDFNGENNVLRLSLPVFKTLVYEPNYSVFKTKEQVKGYLKTVVLNLEDFEAIKPHVFRHELLNIIRFNGFSSHNILSERVEIEKGQGVLYAVSSASTLKEYSIPKEVRVNFFITLSNANENVVVISPENYPDSYEKIVFLDRPIYDLPKNAFTNEKFNEVYYSLSTDRAVFADVFSYLLTLEKKKFINSVEAFESYSVPFEREQFIFSTEVFIELGIFYVEDGVLKRNKNLKNALTNSLVYNTICSIKEGV